jgi:DNA-binding Xre family transcriptional regulator
LNCQFKLNKMKSKLSEIAEPDYDWMADAEWHKKNKLWLDKSRKIALKILSTLKEKNISQTQLADQMGVSRQMISKIVKGRENLTLSTISKIEQILETDLFANDEHEVPDEPSPRILQIEPLI